MSKIKRWQVILGAMILINVLGGCERTNKQNQEKMVEAAKEVENVELAQTPMNDKSEKSEAVKEKWENASRFIRQVLIRII